MQVPVCTHWRAVSAHTHNKCHAKHSNQAEPSLRGELCHVVVLLTQAAFSHTTGVLQGVFPKVWKHCYIKQSTNTEPQKLMKNFFWVVFIGKILCATLNEIQCKLKILKDWMVCKCQVLSESWLALHFTAASSKTSGSLPWRQISSDLQFRQKASLALTQQSLPLSLEFSLAFLEWRTALLKCYWYLAVAFGFWRKKEDFYKENHLKMVIFACYQIMVENLPSNKCKT